MKIKVAERNIELQNVDAYTEARCKEYKIDDNEIVDISLSVSKKEVELERQSLSEQDVSDDLIKNLLFLEKLNLKMLDYDTFFLHSAAIAVDGEGYAFSARSGTGKSTHIRLWKEYFGQRALVINGDKPFLMKKDDKMYVCGSPWSGKECWNTNVIVPLKALCFIERGKKNHIERMSETDMIDCLFRQIRLPGDMEKMNKLLELLDFLVKNTPCYRLTCNMDIEAAKVAYEGMKEVMDNEG